MIPKGSAYDLRLLLRQAMACGELIMQVVAVTVAPASTTAPFCSTGDRPICQGVEHDQDPSWNLQLEVLKDCSKIARGKNDSDESAAGDLRFPHTNTMSKLGGRTARH